MTNIANNIPTLAVTASDHPLEWYRERIAYLSSFMTEERFSLFERTLAQRTHYMTILAENTFHPHNAAALIRHCEAFGVQSMHTIETDCVFDPSQNISRGSDRWLNLVRHHSTAEALSALKAEGYRLVATTPHRESCTPETFDVTKGKFALIFGTEHAGISDEAMEAADEYLRIPMCGMVESLNVSASAAILIYQLTQRIRSQVSNWPLSEEEQTHLLYAWTRLSVKDADRILQRKFEIER
ncbi:MAG: RNA methyltransferase [Alistipes sp.]|nr:RNA methyltransferase [Alistipes sp.]